jgi:hypothetical protein
MLPSKFNSPPKTRWMMLKCLKWTNTPLITLVEYQLKPSMYLHTLAGLPPHVFPSGFLPHRSCSATPWRQMSVMVPNMFGLLLSYFLYFILWIITSSMHLHRWYFSAMCIYITDFISAGQSAIFVIHTYQEWWELFI